MDLHERFEFPDPEISCVILLFSSLFLVRSDLTISQCMELCKSVKLSSSGWFCISIFNTFGFDFETDEWGWQMVAWRVVDGFRCQKRTLNMHWIIEVQFNSSSMIYTFQSSYLTKSSWKSHSLIHQWCISVIVRLMRCVFRVPRNSSVHFFSSSDLVLKLGPELHGTWYVWMIG